MYKRQPKAELASENVEALQKGIVNLKAHVENMRKFGVPVAVAINRFHTDTEAEIAVVDQCCKELGVPYALSEVFAKGGEGGIELAETVLDVLEKTEGQCEFCLLYTSLRVPRWDFGAGVTKQVSGQSFLFS